MYQGKYRQRNGSHMEFNYLSDKFAFFFLFWCSLIGTAVQRHKTPEHYHTVQLSVALHSQLQLDTSRPTYNSSSYLWCGTLHVTRVSEITISLLDRHHIIQRDPTEEDNSRPTLNMIPSRPHPLLPSHRYIAFVIAIHQLMRKMWPRISTICAMGLLLR